MSGASGLTTREAERRLTEVGPNLLVPVSRRPTALRWVVVGLTDPMVILLLLAGVAYVILADFVDAAIVLVAIIPIALVGAALEVRAERALDRLKELTALTSLVCRDGQFRSLPTAAIVPGDLVEVKEGDIVPADGVLVEGNRLAVDESALTGESQPVTRSANAAGDEPDLYAGTTILSGRGVFRVVETGPRSRYGRIGALVANIQEPPTPLQAIIRRLVWQASIIAVAVSLVVAGIELAAGHGLQAALTAGISLAIVALPEEFSIVYTLYLSLGAWRLARQNALVRRLASVETLGATTVICTDKTGTLTLGRLSVDLLVTPDGAFETAAVLTPAARELVEAAVLASEPSPFDPMERSILDYAKSHGVAVEVLHRQRLIQDYPFDPILKYVTHVWECPEGLRIAAKGSIEGILERCHVSRDEQLAMIQSNRALAEQGLRVIAVASGHLESTTGDRFSDEGQLYLRGLLAFSDPARPGVSLALRECRNAGIRVIMVTGDHPVTAHAIAEGLGLPHSDHVATGGELDRADDAQWEVLARDVNIFARVRPEQKYRLVQLLRAQNQVVAMTGDGINDAPALREADIGVAMGQRGTPVARESADLVLLDDNFATIVRAIHDGRRIFENLRRAFGFLIAFETPLLLLALIVPLTGWPLLLLPSMLILSELIVHPTVSLVFENEPPPSDIMRRPPRSPGVGLLAGSDLVYALAVGVSLGAGVLVLYMSFVARVTSVFEARGVAITALFIGQMILVLSLRSVDRPLWQTSVTANPVLPVVVGLTLLILVLILYVPWLAAVFQIAPPGPFGWLVAVLTGAATTLWLEPFKGRLWRVPDT